MLWVFIVCINEKGTERQEKHHFKFIYPELRLEVNKKQQNSYSKEPQLCDTWAWWVTPLILLWECQLENYPPIYLFILNGNFSQWIKFSN